MENSWSISFQNPLNIDFFFFFFFLKRLIYKLLRLIIRKNGEICLPFHNKMKIEKLELISPLSLNALKILIIYLSV